MKTYDMILAEISQVSQKGGTAFVLDNLARLILTYGEEKFNEGYDQGAIDALETGIGE